MRTSLPLDLLERLAVDPGQRTLGQLLQEREWARAEIQDLRRQLPKVTTHPGAGTDATSVPRTAKHPAPASPPAVGSRPGVAPELRLLRANDVADIVGVSRATIYRWVVDGRFPPQVRIGPHAVAWRMSDVLAWQAKLVS